ncbi:unnamed protein product [Brachionus calyciflorus]|uniref:Phosphatidic acid phosphatase type 2/haloperoxidase domain-containing protein n=1 Tax=Brachionus calyciflorus TaxID=104777 RepID=A0A813SPR4_9BILA|nr:unnamed protein product [Brachionus calyciflorus]
MSHHHHHPNEPVHWLKILFDTCSVSALFLTFHLIKHFIKPFKSSFYCNDFSVNMPFRPSTVTNFHLILISLVLPFLVIISTEIFKALHIKSQMKKKSTIFIYKVNFFSKILQFPEQIGNLYINCGSFFFGLVATAVITDFGKVIVGRLRPNFMDVCKPDVNPYTQLCHNRTYLEPGIDFKCTALDPANVDESRLSFPSGHSSLSFYSMIYLILFINYTWKCRRFGLIPRLVQINLLIIAIYTALSRISDNKHHPTDVLAGSCLGILISLTSFYYLTDYIKNSSLKSKYSSLVVNTYDEENLPHFIKDNNNFAISDIDHNYNNNYNI